jgi:hypothetical protein
MIKVNIAIAEEHPWRFSNVRIKVRGVRLLFITY